jgi:hypothetical protein
MGGACSSHERGEEYIRGRSQNRREDNIKKCIIKIGFEGVDWIHLA